VVNRERTQIFTALIIESNVAGTVLTLAYLQAVDLFLFAVRGLYHHCNLKNWLEQVQFCHLCPLLFPDTEQQIEGSPIPHGYDPIGGEAVPFSSLDNPPTTIAASLDGTALYLGVRPGRTELLRLGCVGLVRQQ